MSGKIARVHYERQSGHQKRPRRENLFVHLNSKPRHHVLFTRQPCPRLQFVCRCVHARCLDHSVAAVMLGSVPDEDPSLRGDGDLLVSCSCGDGAPSRSGDAMCVLVHDSSFVQLRV